MGIGTTLWTWLYGKFIGEDEFGNRYYEHKKVSQNGRKRRWVLYKGYPEASKVPAGWHGWLHYTTSQPPKALKRYAWEKPHMRNLTGTSHAYYPPPVHQSIPKKNYEAWVPNQE